jgi:3-hydroxyisobutyrate dehydrogenase
MRSLDRMQQMTVPTASNARTGFIGLGKMGFPMAVNLLGAQLPLTVSDVRADLVSELMARGAASGRGPADVARDSDVIGVCVVDDAQVLDVVNGPEGLLSTAHPGSIIVLHSTIFPETCREVERQAARRHVEVLEVAISGYPAKAVSGDLTLMVGGSAETMGRCDSYLRAIGKYRFHLGRIGAGNAAKLANNVMAIFARIGTYEGLNVARANGVDLEQMIEVAAVSSGNSDALRLWKENNSRHEAIPGSWEGISLPGRRILATALAISREHDIDLPVVAAVVDMMSELEDN